MPNALLRMGHKDCDIATRLNISIRAVYRVANWLEKLWIQSWSRSFEPALSSQACSCQKASIMTPPKKLQNYLQGSWTHWV